MDGALSVADGENDVALVGAVSPKIHPLLLVQYDSLGWCGAPPGEGAAFLLARADGGGEPVLAGYGRGFAAGDRAAALSRAVDEALAMAGVEPASLGWVLPDLAWTPEVREAQDAVLARTFGAVPQRAVSGPEAPSPDTA